MTISFHACLPKKTESLTINLSHSWRSVSVFPKVTGCLLNVRRDKSALRKRDSLFRFGSQLEKRGTHELIHDLAARTGETKVSVSARSDFCRRTVHPGGQAQIPMPLQMPPFWQGHRAWHFLGHAFSQLEGRWRRSLMRA